MALIRSATAASTWMKQLALIPLHGPPCCALGQRRGDGVIGRISKGDANHLRALDRGRAVTSWRISVAAGATRLMGLPAEYKLPTNVNEALGIMGDGLTVHAVRSLAKNLLEPLLSTLPCEARGAALRISIICDPKRPQAPRPGLADEKTATITWRPTRRRPRLASLSSGSSALDAIGGEAAPPRTSRLATNHRAKTSAPPSAAAALK
jgi:hypothetical protein